MASHDPLVPTASEAILLGPGRGRPLLLNRYSQNILFVKEVLLGLGVYVGLSLWLLASLLEGQVFLVSLSG